MTDDRSIAIAVLGGAGLLGVLIGAGSLAATPSGRAEVGGAVRQAGVAAGVVRQRPPQPGDHWGGCNDARAAGTAPIYRGEPGYREEMDGDSDGIACEPHPD